LQSAQSKLDEAKKRAYETSQTLEAAERELQSEQSSCSDSQAAELRSNLSFVVPLNHFSLFELIGAASNQARA
jgi:hypothetical protein